MKIVMFNANSIRFRLPVVLQWLAKLFKENTSKEVPFLWMGDLNVVRTALSEAMGDFWTDSSCRGRNPSTNLDRQSPPKLAHSIGSHVLGG